MADDIVTKTKTYTDKVRTAMYGKEVRSSIADGIDGIAQNVKDEIARDELSKDVGFLKSDVKDLNNISNGNNVYKLDNNKFEKGGWAYSEIGSVPSKIENANRARYDLDNLSADTLYFISTNVEGLSVALNEVDENNVTIAKSGWVNSHIFKTNSNTKKFYLTYKYDNNDEFNSLADLNATKLYSIRNVVKENTYLVSGDKANEVLSDLNKAEPNTNYMLLLTSRNVDNLPDNYPVTGSTGYLETKFAMQNNLYIIKQILTYPPSAQRWIREFNSITTKWANWIEQPYFKLPDTLSETIHIGKGYEYETLRAGISKAIEKNNTTVYVHEGIYNLAEEFKKEISENLSSTYGIKLKNNVKVIFLAGSYVIAKPSLDNNVRTYFNPFYTNGSFELNGLNIEVANTRYCIHDEGGGNIKAKTVYKNCVMKNHSEIYNDNGTPRCYYQCIGGGMGNKHYIEIDNCYFDSLKGDSSDVMAVSYHNGYASNCDGKIFVKNCYFANNNRLGVQHYGNSTVKSKLYANNNSFGKAITCVHEVDGASTPENFEVIQYMNEIRS